ncbi:hypothetical protein OG921_13025 [Aldersonia sp. NBC_00410]|uniref:hypothetical protein n=1 Tax=Aldersonia sp. NBC_00410 TaxID=2975954 RepID=UPI00224E9295|nr:hypothetical protein [Aldersonia sp. NBC_00410]MCX5044088.1 hypothetical protein [Aldersonia sp. NBC_00410]
MSTIKQLRARAQEHGMGIEYDREYRCYWIDLVAHYIDGGDDFCRGLYGTGEIEVALDRAIAEIEAQQAEWDEWDEGAV